MGLPPCHAFFQCSTAGEFLDLKLTQRSADVAVGVPYNIASYALLLMMLAQDTGKVARRLIMSFGSAHIYEPHIENLEKQLRRQPKESPHLVLDPDKTLWDFANSDNPEEDFSLVGYDPHPFIKFGLEV